jgi:hypothetical protein
MSPAQSFVLLNHHPPYVQYLLSITKSMVLLQIAQTVPGIFAADVPLYTLIVIFPNLQNLVIALFLAF